MKGTQPWARWLFPALAVVIWLGVGGGLGPFAGKLGEVATNDQAAFLPQDAESTRVLEAGRAFDRSETIPAIVVWTVDDAGDRADAHQQAATAAMAALEGQPGVAGPPSPVIVSADGLALQSVVPLAAGADDETRTEAMTALREAADGVPGTTAALAGPAASQEDLSEAFAGIDGLLLGVALTTVLIILLLVYRSVLLPLVIITGSVLALCLACAVVYALADRDVLRVDGQVQGILFILVIGAATDYALLLAARYREEVTGAGHPFAAALAAVRRSAGAIVASAGTVGLGLLALLASGLTNNRALGPVGAIGIACAVLSTLTFLPAVLALLGRAAYWPAKPKPVPSGTEGRGIWQRVASLVDRRPRRVWVTTALVLAGFAALSPTLDSRGTPLDEIFVGDAPSVAAQQVLGEHFPGGSGNPAVILADAGHAAEVTAAAGATDGVAAAAPVTASGRPGDGPPLVVDGTVRIDATLADSADSEAAQRTVERLRTAVHAIDGADALVGGYTAQQYDTQETASRDRLVIVPIVLVIIVAILTVLLRSLLMPLLLVGTVALNYLATLGISALLFQNILGFSGTDASVPLYGFVFLVALGVDYNIFLMSRVREETLTGGVRTGMLRGLVSTGGVITSAGVVLAATFSALAVIPLSFLAQIAFIVAFGVLLDTLVVRSLLVPALVMDIGPRAWWPSAIGHRGAAAAPRKEPAGRAG
ncbi:MMPL family transporter [Streptomyces harbinensis]|uniref:MMPL family transporter n=1 Tax=Streptomyces harbinensis TaxID=1176198 RepID=UPI0037202500